jgi:hypothetical protein
VTSPRLVADGAARGKCGVVTGRTAGQRMIGVVEV